MDSSLMYKTVLQEFFQGADSVVARMLNLGYLTKPAKTAGHVSRRGSEYLIDQSMYTHIVNGVFGITRLLMYLASEGLYKLTEEEYRTMLAMYINHDLHKDRVIEHSKYGEFDITLASFEQEGELLGLFDFAPVIAEQMRVGMMHLDKKMVGDLSQTPPNTSKLVHLVRLADHLASVQEPSQIANISEQIQELSPRLVGRYTCYYHQLNEYRGLSTQILHKAITEILEQQYHCYPLLFFADGVLYLGSPNTDDSVSPQNVIATVSKSFFAAMQEITKNMGKEVAQKALEPKQTVKFELYGYLASNASDLLTVLESYAQNKKPGKKALLITDLVRKRSESQSERKKFAEKYPSPAAFCSRFFVQLEDETDADYATKWLAVSSLIKGLESIARDMKGDRDALPWLLEAVEIPEMVSGRILADLGELRSGGVADHCLIMAYHYLKRQTYRDGLSAHAVDVPTVLSQLRMQMQPLLEKIMTPEIRQQVIDRKLALTQDLATYLSECFHCTHPAFAVFEKKVGNVLVEYEREKKPGTYQHLCVLCGRIVPREMSDTQIKTAILEDQALVFSNKLVPRQKVRSQMIWCPMCYLEFTLRQIAGLGYSRSADSALSDRLYLYLFPDYFFTPELVAMMGNALRPFKDETTIKLRQYGKDDDPSLPTLWIREGTFSADMRYTALELLRKAAQRLEEPALDIKKRPTGRKRKEQTGDRIRGSQLEMALNYYMLVCEKTTVQAAPERAPTRSELWCKAIYTALVAYLLLGVRVYITDKPYLTVSRSTELKNIITLDAPHALLRELLQQSAAQAVISLVPAQGEKIAIDVKSAMHALSALWVVNEGLTGQSVAQSRNQDKQIANRLNLFNSNTLAGAAFFKERLRDDLSASPEFTSACEYLLTLSGGWKVDIAKTLTQQSLAIFLPSIPRDGKGKAHQYERLFRLALESLKTMAEVEDASEMKARIAGALLKTVMRQRDIAKRGGAVGSLNSFGDELTRRVHAFAATIVDELFDKRCGRNISKLLKEENSIADGIFFYTEQDIRPAWEAYRQRRASQQANKLTSR